ESRRAELALRTARAAAAVASPASTLNERRCVVKIPIGLAGIVAAGAIQVAVLAQQTAPRGQTVGTAGTLKDHITIAVNLIKAAKAKDDAALKEQDRKWHQNAEDIATFLSGANRNWPKATLVEMMNTHLSTTTNEVVARLNQKWDDDVRAFDAVYDHIL